MKLEFEDNLKKVKKGKTQDKRLAATGPAAAESDTLEEINRAISEDKNDQTSKKWHTRKSQA